ncbi:DUF4142 domain-containing protein [Mucilaginibacter sp. RB4R14]|uniref:DUF4142 domain-containing protein n=1 Tax=Mucilaginibacter aurantiaciroseus TaxID=2949308 RepID=UPI0020903316|nr:DUF4142 domain-containing protein [Mucilaginibacter aurantiaciroseus]MCO5935159.1 DUF4142 domain-containing protein [Mucilaginibacter aurantiaciroseus]
MMKRTFCIVLAFATLISMQACNNRKAKNYNNIKQSNEEGISFVKNALESGAAEIKLSQLALTNSKNPQMLEYAKQVIADNTFMEAELKTVSGSKGNTDTLTAIHQTQVDSLIKKTDEAFDKMYIQVMVIDHENVIKVFKAGETNSDKKLKEFAIKSAPKLKQHLTRANKICAGLK